MVLFYNLPWSSSFVYVWLWDEKVMCRRTSLEAVDSLEERVTLLIGSWNFYIFKAYNSNIHFVNKLCRLRKYQSPAGYIHLSPDIESKLKLALSCLAVQLLCLSCLPVKYCLLTKWIWCYHKVKFFLKTTNVWSITKSLVLTWVFQSDVLCDLHMKMLPNYLKLGRQLGIKIVIRAWSVWLLDLIVNPFITVHSFFYCGGGFAKAEKEINPTFSLKWKRSLIMHWPFIVILMTF